MGGLRRGIAGGFGRWGEVYPWKDGGGGRVVGGLGGGVWEWGRGSWRGGYTYGVCAGLGGFG